MKSGDVLLLNDESLLYIVSFVRNGKSTVLLVDLDEHSCVDLKKYDIRYNLGSSQSVLANFYIARSIHLRLNKIAKI
jgi:hypothetical protein